MMKPFFVTAFVLVLSAFVCFEASAVEPDEILDDPVLEERARDISKNLRCLVCQNQSIDDSNAPLARDLRILVRERLVAGDSDSDVIRFAVTRYGDYVLLKPPFKLVTYGLWFGPLIIFLLGAVAVFFYLRRQRQPATASSPAATLSQEEEKKIKNLLNDDGGDNA